MPNDHFVAQTYLKRWCDPTTNMLQGYSKTIDKEFPCRTQDVCRQWDWDFRKLHRRYPFGRAPLKPSLLECHAYRFIYPRCFPWRRPHDRWSRTGTPGIL